MMGIGLVSRLKTVLMALLQGIIVVREETNVYHAVIHVHYAL